MTDFGNNASDSLSKSNPELGKAIGSNAELAAAINSNPSLAAAIASNPALASTIAQLPSFGAALKSASAEQLQAALSLPAEAKAELAKLQSLAPGVDLGSKLSLAAAGAKFEALPGGGFKATLGNTNGKPVSVTLPAGATAEFVAGALSEVLTCSGAASSPAQGKTNRKLDAAGGMAKATFNLGEGDNTLNADSIQFTASSGKGNDTYNLKNADGLIVDTGGSNRIIADKDSTFTYQITGPDAFGTTGGRKGLAQGDAALARGGRGGTFGKPSERDTITGFSTDDVLRISKASLPGTKLKLGKLRKSDFEIVSGRGAVNRSNASIVYDSRSGGLFYNPQGPARPVELIRMDAGLDITRNNIVIF